MSTHGLAVGEGPSEHPRAWTASQPKRTSMTSALGSSMVDRAPYAPPSIDTAALDDKNFATGDLAQAWGVLGLPRFLLQRDRKEVEAYFVEDAQKNRRGLVEWFQNGAWTVQGPPGTTLALLWRQRTEDHHAEGTRNLVHMGYHRYKEAVANEENASIYCLASPDQTVRMFLSFKGQEGILDSPTGRPVLKMAPGEHHGDVRLLDAYDDPVATVHTEVMAVETHDVSMEEAEDPFPVALFAITLAIEMTLRYGQWRSPYQRLQL